MQNLQTKLEFINMQSHNHFFQTGVMQLQLIPSQTFPMMHEATILQTQVHKVGDQTFVCMQAILSTHTFASHLPVTAFQV